MTPLILSLLFLFSATTTAQPAGVTKQAALDQEFEIKFGQQVLIKDEGLRINFSNVLEDSRCPTGVRCIWAGNGKVLLKISKSRKRATTMRLNTGINPKQGSYHMYEVKLVNLNPYPKEGITIKKRDYVATVIVSRK